MPACNLKKYTSIRIILIKAFITSKPARIGWHGSVAHPSSHVWTAVGGQQIKSPSGNGAGSSATIIPELYHCIIWYINMIFTLIHQSFFWIVGDKVELGRWWWVLTAACSHTSEAAVWGHKKRSLKRVVGYILIYILASSADGAKMNYWWTIG